MLSCSWSAPSGPFLPGSFPAAPPCRAACSWSDPTQQEIRLNPPGEVIGPRQQMPAFLHLFPLVKHRGRRRYCDPLQLWLFYSYWAGGSVLDRWAQTARISSHYLHVSGFVSGSSTVFSSLPDIFFPWLSCIGSDFSKFEPLDRRYWCAIMLYLLLLLSLISTHKCFCFIMI